MIIEKRPRRLRKNNNVRSAVRETIVTPENLILPVFIADKSSKVSAMPGQQRYSLDDFRGLVNRASESGLFGLSLFPLISDDKKNSKGSESINENNMLMDFIKASKEENKNLQIMTDLALDPYSTDGHDGIVKDGQILNDETVQVLTQMAELHASVGADWVGPSDMMDGRVEAIRGALDHKGYIDTGIISYSVKYASAFYGPFRDALDSAPKFGDKKTYQMDPANRKEALKEALLDEEEGADILMVKPGLSYLDILREVTDSSLLPTAAYNVSGEYSMVKAASEKGWIDEKSVRDEMLLSFKRAGASLILSYFALDFAEDYAAK